MFICPLISPIRLHMFILHVKILILLLITYEFTVTKHVGHAHKSTSINLKIGEEYHVCYFLNKIELYKYKKKYFSLG
jgi:hypothetical protein